MWVDFSIQINSVFSRNILFTILFPSLTRKEYLSYKTLQISITETTADIKMVVEEFSNPQILKICIKYHRIYFLEKSIYNLSNFQD